jgi:hypothetical protein
MRILVLTLLVSAAVLGQSTSTSNAAATTLTDKDIVQMHVAGLGNEVIIAEIQSSNCSFNTAPADLASLKAAGLEDAVILAMLKAHTVEPADLLTAPPHNVPVTPASAKLHVYRERAFTGSLRTMPIFMDEEKTADLVNGRKFTLQIKPGKHTFRCLTKEEAITVDIEPGREYFLRAELIQSFTKNRWRIVHVANEQGELDMQGLKPLDPSGITPEARSIQSH